MSSTEHPVTEGVTPREIARRFGVTQLAVRNHLRELYGTLPHGTTRWVLDPEQVAAVSRRLTGLGYVGAEGEAGPRVRPRPWSPPEQSDLAVDLPAEPESRVVSRAEFALQAQFGQWLTEQGTPPALLPLPTGSGVVQPDLFVPDRGWLVEAKKSSDRQYVRMAIGQVLDYCHLAAAAGLATTPAILLPDRPASDLLTLVRSLDIALAHRADATFTVIEPKASTG